MRRGDLPIVKDGLIERAREVCRQLLPDGQLEGGQWVSHNPVTNDRGKTPALKVRLSGGDTGAWRCWRAGDKGDMIDLVAYCLRTDRAGALAWGRDFLGLKTLTAAERAGLQRAHAKRAADREKRDQKRRADKLMAADRLFNVPDPGTVGPARISVPQGVARPGEKSPAEAHARAYWAARAAAIDDRAARYAFRFSAATEWWKAAKWQADPASGRRFKAEAGPLFPAIHAAMRNRMGIVTCCHVTFLDPAIPAKAPVTPAKLMYGEALGTAIELYSGPSGIPFWMADREGLAPHPLIIAEGIETAASFVPHVPEARCWAAGSLAGIAGAPVDLDCVSWILFARDNNTGNAQAQAQFERALDGLKRSGKPVHVEASHVGDDFNDLAQGEV